LYLFSRISTGLAKLAVKKNYVHSPDKSFSIFAAVTWGIVMWLFRHHPQTLQGGLQTSMTYLYNDSDVFNNLNSLLWHNKETAK
jgi:peroxisomal membrane protein 4